MSTHKCVNGCKPSSDTPFVFGVCCTGIEMGVLADINGNPTNRFADGMVGVSEEVIDRLTDHDWGCLNCSECGAELKLLEESDVSEN